MNRRLVEKRIRGAENQNLSKLIYSTKDGKFLLFLGKIKNQKRKEPLIHSPVLHKIHM